MQRRARSADFPEIDMSLPSEPPPSAREDGDMTDLDVAPLSPVLRGPPRGAAFSGRALGLQRGRKRSTSGDGINRPKVDAGTTTTCCACLDISDYLIPNTCGCCYCISCFKHHIEVGLATRGSFPPKCCGQEIDLLAARDFLDAKILNRYNEVREEFGSKNPTYCAACTTFLPGPVTSGDIKACHKCSEQTCTKCKNLRSAHATAQATDDGLEECPVVDIPSAVADLIEKEEWSRCPSCKHVVEKSEGCDWMECMCGETFCYRCGSAFEEGENDDDDPQCGCPNDLPAGNDEANQRYLQEEDDGNGEPPRYSFAVDAHGRIRCTHEVTRPLDDGGDRHGGRCNGCLQEMPAVRRCEICHLELCSECLR